MNTIVFFTILKFLFVYPGSGKSLALLCASLAWQETEQKKVTEFNSLLEQATANQVKDIFLKNFYFPPPPPF